ncbi:hypothetical protein QJS66_22025 [Kocuria rhizophila]|nr:hypothetical protein QJS66_22025 [Kocuria rhizophila]
MAIGSLPLGMALAPTRCPWAWRPPRSPHRPRGVRRVHRVPARRPRGPPARDWPDHRDHPSLVNARHVFYGFSYPTHLLRTPFTSSTAPDSLRAHHQRRAPHHRASWYAHPGRLHLFWVLGATGRGRCRPRARPASWDGLTSPSPDFLPAVRRCMRRGRAADQDPGGHPRFIGVGLLLPRDLFLLGAMLCYALLCVSW